MPVKLIDLATLEIPEGWTLVRLPDKNDDIALLTTAEPGSLMATIDFTRRGFRGGCTHYGHFIGDDFARHKKRKRHSGRRWPQSLTNQATAYLRDVLDGKR